MNREDPVACSLTKEEVSERIASAASLATGALLNVETHGPEARLSFRPNRDTREGVDAFVAAESQCCPFFDFDVTEDDEALTLWIKAPEDGSWATRGVVAGFVGGWELPV